MISLDTSGIDAFNNELSLALLQMDQYVSEVFVRWTARIFTDLVNTTPQWSGNLAQNWNFSVNGLDYSYEQIPNKTGDGQGFSWAANNHGVFSRGDPLAVDMALARMQAVPKPTWRDTVYFTNNTPSEEGEDLAYLLENGGKVRPINLVAGQVVLINNTVLIEQERGLIE